MCLQPVLTFIEVSYTQTLYNYIRVYTHCALIAHRVNDDPLVCHCYTTCILPHLDLYTVYNHQQRSSGDDYFNVAIVDLVLRESDTFAGQTLANTNTTSETSMAEIKRLLFRNQLPLRDQTSGPGIQSYTLLLLPLVSPEIGSTKSHGSFTLWTTLT